MRLPGSGAGACLRGAGAPVTIPRLAAGPPGLGAGAEIGGETDAAGEQAGIADSDVGGAEARGAGAGGRTAQGDAAGVHAAGARRAAFGDITAPQDEIDAALAQGLAVLLDAEIAAVAIRRGVGGVARPVLVQARQQLRRKEGFGGGSRRVGGGWA